MYLWRRSGWKVERDKCGERFSREKGREFSAWIIFSFRGKLMTKLFWFLSLSHHHRTASLTKGHPQKLSSVLLRLFRLFNPHYTQKVSQQQKNCIQQQQSTMENNSEPRWIRMNGAGREFGLTKNLSLLPWSQLQWSTARTVINRSAIVEPSCSFPFDPILMDILRFIFFLHYTHTRDFATNKSGLFSNY